jgi:amino acid transporter
MYAYSGGAIGAGLFVGSGGAFQTGGPGSVLLGFMIVGTLHAIRIATW